jgi:hypothetical protein
MTNNASESEGNEFVRVKGAVEDRVVTFEASVPWVHLLRLLSSNHEAQICNYFSWVVCGH